MYVTLPRGPLMEPLLIGSLKMCVALVATGWWMYVDQAITPKAVVVCVIVFNAAFGYRLVRAPSPFLCSVLNDMVWF